MNVFYVFPPCLAWDEQWQRADPHVWGLAAVAGGQDGGPVQRQELGDKVLKLKWSVNSSA